MATSSRQLSGSHYLVGDGLWVDGANQTSPTSGTIVVDSGALPAGRYLFAVQGATSAAAHITIQHRNAANSSTIHDQDRRPAAGDIDFLFPNEIEVAENERLRVVMGSDLTGTLMLSIFLKVMP